MSMTPDEAAYEEGIDKLFKEWESEHAETFREEGRRDYEFSRVASYFRRTEFDQRIGNRLIEAQSVLQHSPTGSLLLSYSCIEIALRKELFSPIIFAFTTQDIIAHYFADQIMRRDLLPKPVTSFASALLEMEIGLTVEAIELAEQKKSLWKHVYAVRDIRNRVAHNVDTASSVSARNCIALANFIIKRVCIPLRRELSAWE